MSCGHTLDQREHVLGDVTGRGLPFNLGGQIVGRILESLGGNGTHKEIKVIGDLLDESLATKFESLNAGHGDIPFVIFDT